MDTSQSLEKKAVSWKRIMLAAHDAYLVQLQEPLDLTLQNASGEALGLPTMNGLQNFVVIPLGGQLLDGFHLWGLTLPTILATNGNEKNANSHQQEASHE